jgi:hypothetical protein
MLTNLEKSQFTIAGERGLPENYPIPCDIDNLLFYIQRNLNKNTIVYALNTDALGMINPYFPMNVFWIKYTEGGNRVNLNFIQNKAFGYTSNHINSHTFEFYMDSYPSLRFFIIKSGSEHKILTKIDDSDAIINNIYVYANEFGLFPKVEYIELYGEFLSSGFPCYKKILI